MSENEKYLKDERLYKVLHEKHYDGIGPTDDEEGLPLALRSVSTLVLYTCWTIYIILLNQYMWSDGLRPDY